MDLNFISLAAALTVIKLFWIDQHSVVQCELIQNHVGPGLLSLNLS